MGVRSSRKRALRHVAGLALTAAATVALGSAWGAVGCDNSRTPVSVRPTMNEGLPNFPATPDNAGPGHSGQSGQSGHSGATPGGTSNGPEPRVGKPGDPLPYEAVVVTAGVAFEPPNTWQRVVPQPTRMSPRLAEFRLWGTTHDTFAELAITVAAGTAEANLNRWIGQFGANAEAAKAQFEHGKLKIFAVTASGTYTDAMAANPAAKPNHGLFGLVVEGGPNGSVFFKCVGPKEIIAAHQAELEAMLKTIRAVE